MFAFAFLFVYICSHVGWFAGCHPSGPARSHFGSIVAPLVTCFIIVRSNLMQFRPHFGGYSITPGTASCIRLWYSPRALHTRHNAKHLQQTCKKLLKKRTSKRLAENLQRTSKKHARNAKMLQRTSKNPAKRNLKITNGMLHSSTQQQPQRGPSFIIRGRRCARR